MAKKKNNKCDDDFMNCFDPELMVKDNKSKSEPKISEQVEKINEAEQVEKIKETEQVNEVKKTFSKLKVGKKNIKKGGTKMTIQDIKRMNEEKKLQKELEDKKKEENLKEAQKRSLEAKRIENEEKEKKLQKSKKSEEKPENKNIAKTEKVELKELETEPKFENVVSEDLKSPICCILGHVDTGKTKILDNLRRSNIQESEAGGITQQIGATFFPSKSLSKLRIKSQLPGFLVIDTPGHETFANLRSRGSSLCDLAILVVDITNILEKQTLESIELLKKRKCFFIIALNKIDRIFQWKKNDNFPFMETFEKQGTATKNEFNERLSKTMLEFNEIGLNVRMFNDMATSKTHMPIVPTSAITGEGLKDLIEQIAFISENFMKKKIKFNEKNFACTILEVKTTEGYGKTADVILSDGVLEENDKILICTMRGPVETFVKNILLPEPLKELRVKSLYKNVKFLKASMGVKLFCPRLEDALPGTRIIKINKNDDINELRENVMQDFEKVFSKAKLSENGVHVHSTTLGSLEALISFIEQNKIQIGSVGIGELTKTDVLRVINFRKVRKEFGCILNFDQKIDKEVLEFAAENKIKIFTSETIYRLLEDYLSYFERIRQETKKSLSKRLVFPCALKIIPEFVFNKRSPLIFGVDIIKGKLMKDTTLFVYKDRKITKLGKVTSIERNKKAVNSAVKGEKVALKIETDENPRVLGRHFELSDVLESYITRANIDTLKEGYQDEMTKEDWLHVIELKGKIGIL